MVGYHQTMDSGTGSGTGTTNTWTVWCDSTTASSTTTTASNNIVWVNWASATSASTTVTADDTVWCTWSSSSGGDTGTGSYTPWVGTTREETEEERAERERLAEERRQRLEEEKKIKEEARQRAEKLLLGFLDRKQRKDWVKGGKFYLYSGKKRYRIKRGRIGNVELVDQKGEVLERYCCHPQQMVPDADCALSQMLALQHNEDHFLKLANIHHRRPGFDRTEYERRLAA